MDAKQKIKAIIGIINNGEEINQEEYDDSIRYWKINPEYTRYLMEIFNASSASNLITKMSELVKDNPNVFNIYNIEYAFEDLYYNDCWIMLSKNEY